MPRLRVKLPTEEPKEIIYELEAAREGFKEFPESFLVVEGKLIRSYQELVEMVARPPYNTREILEAEVIQYVAGG
ncbi:MAG: hypothetical protein HYX96_04025 [Chloroflexi bacterium]|nr:hypothetical protein [Chloroflexota bacterium]